MAKSNLRLVPPDSVWLRSLGLGKYEAAFRENEIDEAVLPNLTAEDLKDLGVSIVGHRRKLLEAIAALRNDTSAAGACIAAAGAHENTGPDLTLHGRLAQHSEQRDAAAKLDVEAKGDDPA